MQVGGIRINDPIKYPMELDMGPYCIQNVEQEGWGTVFNLGGLILHHGTSAASGHYSYLQRLPNGQWLSRDDQEVTLQHDALDFRTKVSGLVYYCCQTDRFAASAGAFVAESKEHSFLTWHTKAVSILSKSPSSNFAYCFSLRCPMLPLHDLS